MRVMVLVQRAGMPAGWIPLAAALAPGLAAALAPVLAAALAQVLAAALAHQRSSRQLYP